MNRLTTQATRVNTWQGQVTTLKNPGIFTLMVHTLMFTL